MLPSLPLGEVERNPNQITLLCPVARARVLQQWPRAIDQVLLRGSDFKSYIAQVPASHSVRTPAGKTEWRRGDESKVLGGRMQIVPATVGRDGLKCTDAQVAAAGWSVSYGKPGRRRTRTPRTEPGPLRIARGCVKYTAGTPRAPWVHRSYLDRTEQVSQ